MAVRLHDGMASWSGSKGDYYWLGIAGTNFLVSPENDFISIFLAQEWMSGLESRNLIFSLVSQTILNKDGQ